jgi:predicted DCC family thiol-disulfide oxidoreductase YuxK
MDEQYIIFFDADCAFCRKAVMKIFQADKKESFLFSPLKGATFIEVAKEQRDYLFSLNTLVLVKNPFSERPEIKVRSEAVKEIFWLLGGKYKILAILSSLFFADLFYQWIAGNRTKVHPDKGVALPANRLLP